MNLSFEFHFHAKNQVKNLTQLHHKHNNQQDNYADQIPIYLEYCPVDDEVVSEVVMTINDELVTKRGLRSLSPRNENYRGVYLFHNITPARVDEAYEEEIEKNGYPYYVTKNVFIKGFETTSGKGYSVSPNEFMFRDVNVVENGEN